MTHTIHHAMIGGRENVGGEWDSEENSPSLKWARELGLPMDELCNVVDIAGVPTGGPDCPMWQYCRPLEFFTGPYYDWDTEPTTKTDVWLLFMLEESSVLMHNTDPKLGWYCGRGPVQRLTDAEMGRMANGLYAVIPSHLPVRVKGDYSKGIWDDE